MTVPNKVAVRRNVIDRINVGNSETVGVVAGVGESVALSEVVAVEFELFTVRVCMLLQSLSAT